MITDEGAFLWEFLPCMVMNDITYRSKYSIGVSQMKPALGIVLDKGVVVIKKIPMGTEAGMPLTHQPQLMYLLHKNPV